MHSLSTLAATMMSMSTTCDKLEGAAIWIRISEKACNKLKEPRPLGE